MNHIRINLDSFNVVINIDENGGGTITSDLVHGFDQIESLLLAMACAGIDLTGHAMLDALEAAVDACMNNEEDEDDEETQTYHVHVVNNRTTRYTVEASSRAVAKDMVECSADADADFGHKDTTAEWYVDEVLTP